MIDEYYAIFESLIGRHLRNSIIFKCDSEKRFHEYTPFRHSHDQQIERILADLMRRYIYLYAYSEKEVINEYSKGRLADLEVAATRALRERLPHRTGDTNGLYSELFLDLLITLFSPNTYKLATRTIYRQRSDNQEIKGFDGMHIVYNEEHHEIWLGQAKMGQLNYCVSSIASDLNEKTNILYTSEQLYFLADKEKSAIDISLELLDKINDISWNAEGLSINQRADRLKTFFKSENITLVYPCLLAYSKPETYQTESEIDNEIKKELAYMINKFDEKFVSLIDIPYEVLIWFIPIRDLQELRTSMEV